MYLDSLTQEAMFAPYPGPSITHVVVQVVIESGIVGSIYIDMSVGAGKGLPEEGIVSLGISSVGGVEVF